MKIGTQDVDGTVDKVDTGSNKVTVKPTNGGTPFMIDMPAQGQPIVTKAEMTDEEYDQRCEALYNAIEKAKIEIKVLGEDVGQVTRDDTYEYDKMYEYGEFSIDFGIPLTQEDMAIFIDSGMISDKLPRDTSLSKDAGIDKPYFKIAEDGHSVVGFWEGDEPVRTDRYYDPIRR